MTTKSTEQQPGEAPQTGPACAPAPNVGSFSPLTTIQPPAGPSLPENRGDTPITQAFRDRAWPRSAQADVLQSHERMERALRKARAELYPYAHLRAGNAGRAYAAILEGLEP